MEFQNLLEENTNGSKVKKIQKNSFIKEVSKNRFLYFLTLPGIIFIFVFCYLPIAGIIIAFEDFQPIKGMFRSNFIGLKNFEFFFTSPDFITVTFNTVYLNILFIFTGLFFSILIAIFFSEVNNRLFKKISQSLAILPNFLSWTVVAMFCLAFFSADAGFLNRIFRSLGMEQIAFFSTPKVWPLLLVILRIWKGAGFGSIIYLAGITGIDRELYDSAKIDGAGRIQQIFKITLPHLKNIAVMLTLMSIGGIFHGDFGMIYTIIGDTALLFPTTDVIDTYVFRQLRTLGDMGMASAVGLYQSVIGFITVLVVNTITKKIDPQSAIF